MAEKEIELMDDRGGFGVGEDVIGDRPRRFQRRRPRQLVPDYVDWKDVDYLRQFVPERGKISVVSQLRSSERVRWQCCRSLPTSRNY